jgi:N-acetylglucosamine-6-phosphate deacetylase
MVTLAPERSGALDATAKFAAAGAVVAAGHSLATLDQLRRAIDRGLSFVTHVGNASDWPSRPFDAEAGFRRSEPNVVGAFLIEKRLRGSVILDGHHLHPELARALVELRGPDAVVLVSDATPAAGLPPGRYKIGGLDAEIRPGGYATTGESLAGSVIALVDAVRTAVQHAKIPLETAIRMASTTPAKIIGVGAKKGSLVAGADADLLLLGPALEVKAVYHRGVQVRASAGRSGR